MLDSEVRISFNCQYELDFERRHLKKNLTVYKDNKSQEGDCSLVLSCSHFVCQEIAFLFARMHHIIADMPRRFVKIRDMGNDDSEKSCIYS